MFDPLFWCSLKRTFEINLEARYNFIDRYLMKIVHSSNGKLCIDTGFVYLPKVLLGRDKVNS